MDQQLPRSSCLPSNKFCTKLLLHHATSCVQSAGSNTARGNVLTSKKEKLRKFEELSLQALSMINAPHTRAEVSRSFGDDPIVENRNVYDWLSQSHGQQVRASGFYSSDLHHSSGVASQRRDRAHRRHKNFSSTTRNGRYHPYRRRIQTGVKLFHSATSDSETLNDYYYCLSSEDIGCPGAKILNFEQESPLLHESLQFLVSTKVSTDCECFLARHSSCSLSKPCNEVSSCYDKFVGDFTICDDSNLKIINDEHWASELAPSCKCPPMCAQSGDAHERVTRWRVTLLVAGTLPPLQVSKICDLIEGSSCSGAGYSARSHDEVTGCLKVVTDLGDELHFPVVQLHPPPCRESWTLELLPASTNYIRKLLNLSEMAHLQRSASESYSSNVLPPVGLERTSRLYAFKLMKNEKENVRKLLPYFIEKSKTDDKYVPFRPRRLSASKLETDKRKSDVCDVLMYRDPLSKHGSAVPEGHFDNDTSQTIRLCGIPLGNRPLTTSGNVFCTMRRSGTMRFTSPPTSPLFSAGGSPSSSPQRRLVDRDCSVPPGILPTPPARAGDSLSSAPPIALGADRHDAKNTPQGPYGDHQIFLETVPSETSIGLIFADDSCNSSLVEKHCETICVGTKLAPSQEKEPLDVRILPCAGGSPENEFRQHEKDAQPETNSVLPDFAQADVGLLGSPHQHVDTSPQLDTTVSGENGCPNSVSPTYGDSKSALCNTYSASEFISKIPASDLCPEGLSVHSKEPTLISPIDLQERETVSDSCSNDASLNSEKIELEIAGITNQIGCQEIDVNCPTGFIGERILKRAEIPDYSFSSLKEENGTNSNNYIYGIGELHNCERNLPLSNMQFPQSERCADQNMISVDETTSKDVSAKVVHREYAIPDRASVICEPTQTNTTSPCDALDFQGIESASLLNNFNITENFRARDLSQSENISELVVFEKLFHDMSCDSNFVDSPHLRESLVVTEPAQLASTTLKCSPPPVIDVRSNLEHENEEETFKHSSFILTENHENDSFCGSGFRDSVSSSLGQKTIGILSEHDKDFSNLLVASKGKEISSADDRIHCGESDILKFNLTEETSPASILEASKAVEKSAKISNWSTVCGGPTLVEPYFEKSVNTFIDEDPCVIPFPLSELACIEPIVAFSEQNDLLLEKTDEADRIIVNTSDYVPVKLLPEFSQKQSSVEVSHCVTFSTVEPDELNISASSERLLIQNDPLTCASGVNDDQVKALCTEINDSPLETVCLTPNSEIIPIVHINPEINEDSLDPAVEDKGGQASSSINGVSDQITEMSVCTININPICTSESVVQTSTCNISSDNSETRVSVSDAPPLARNSRPRQTCANDSNRGQALADRAAKIARMHGASPSKPRPFAFPADVIRSPSQSSKNAQSSYYSKEPNIDACAIRSKSASPMTQKRVKRETTAKRLKSTSPNNRLRVNLMTNDGEPNENSVQVTNSSVTAVAKPILATESQSKRISFINTVYVKVPSTGEVNSSPEASSPATYISNFTRVTYSDVTCNDRENTDPVKQKTVRTELKLPRVSLIEEVEKINDDLTRWASYIANKMLIEIFDFESPKWKEAYFARVCPIAGKILSSREFMPANSSCSHLVETAESPDSVLNDDSLSFAQETSQKGAVSSPGNSASSADRRTGREEDSTTSSSFSSEAWWGQGGPVTHREQLPLKEDVELAPQWPGLPVPSVPESDVDRAGYVSDEDFEAMDEDMRRLEEKIRQFEHELEEDLDMSLVEETSHKMPNFGLLDKAKLRSSPLPTEYPPVCLKKTKHFSFMSKKEIDDYLKTDSESGSSSSSSFDDDLFFVKKKIKLKPGDRKCFSLDLKKRSLIDECKSECLMKILSIPGSDARTERVPDDVSSNSKIEERDNFEECLIENEFKMMGQYWRSEDGLAVVDSEGLADFYAGANPSGVCFIFEDESDDEDILDESIALAFGEPDIPHHEPSLESCRTPTPTENISDSAAIPNDRPASKAEKKSKFVSSFKNSFVKATKSIGPKFGGKLNEPANENPIKSGPNSPLVIDPASFISDILSGKTKPDSATSKTVGVADNVATFPASSESDACDSSIISGEYYASPAICVLSDEDSRVPEYSLFHQLTLRKEGQPASSLSAPPPPIRKSSLDAVSTTTGSFRRQSGGMQETTPRRMVSEIPRVLPPPPCVPPRTTTLNYYPVRSHPIHYRNTVKSADVNVDSFYKDIDYSSRQPDSAQRPKTTSVRQLKRRQQERKLELAEEMKEEATGCNFCLRRSRTLQDNRHNRVQLRRSSPHPKALSLPQRRSWPPRK